MTGDMVFKKYYTAKHKELLEKLNEMKKNAMKPAEKNLYSVLFTIVREEFDTVHKFIK
jgi:DNA replication initiation complex subunit (GINS family)